MCPVSFVLAVVAAIQPLNSVVLAFVTLCNHIFVVATHLPLQVLHLRFDSLISHNIIAVVFVVSLCLPSPLGVS